MPKNHYQVRYSWRESNGERREGRTVVTHYSQLEAEAKFQRQNPHVSVEHQRAIVAPEPVASGKEVSHAA